MRGCGSLVLSKRAGRLELAWEMRVDGKIENDEWVTKVGVESCLGMLGRPKRAFHELVWHEFKWN